MIGSSSFSLILFATIPRCTQGQIVLSTTVCDGSMIWELCSPVRHKQESPILISEKVEDPASYDVVWRGMISSRSRRLS